MSVEKFYNEFPNKPKKKTQFFIDLDEDEKEKENNIENSLK